VCRISFKCVCVTITMTLLSPRLSLSLSLYLPVSHQLSLSSLSTLSSVLSVRLRSPVSSNETDDKISSLPSYTYISTMATCLKRVLRLSVAMAKTAAHCTTLQHTATHCNTLQHTTTHCNTLQHAATRWNWVLIWRLSVAMAMANIATRSHHSNPQSQDPLFF